MFQVLACVLLFAFQPADAPPRPAEAPPRAAVNVLEMGAIADGQTDCAPAIQRAIDRVSEQGGEVIIPAAERPYLIRSGLTISSGGVTLRGSGATIRFADGAVAGRVVHAVRVMGTPTEPITGVTISGLTIDANYWAQPGARDPCAVDITFASGVTLDRVTVRNAATGISFGPGVTDSEARDCTVTRWYDTAYAAVGNGRTGSCRGVRFTRCTARESLDERAGGPPGTRGQAWRIADGAHAVTLTECVVERCGGNGFVVRNSPSEATVATAGVRFIRCRADEVARFGFAVEGGSPRNTVESITLESCRSDSACSFSGDLRGLTILNSRFGGTVTIGPVDGGIVRDSRFGWVRVWSTDVGTPDEPGGYRTSVLFERCEIENPVSVFGNPHFVRFEDE